MGKALAQDQDESDDSAIDDLYKAVLIAPTLEDLKPAIIAATKGCTVGIHYAGDENKWMKETIGYQVQMVDLAQVIHRFFAPLRPLVQDAHFSQSKTCLVMGGEWLPAHRAENDARMSLDTTTRFVRLLHSHQALPLP